MDYKEDHKKGDTVECNIGDEKQMCTYVRHDNKSGKCVVKTQEGKMVKLDPKDVMKVDDDKEEMKEETAAAETLDTKPSYAADSSKTAMMSTMVNAMAGMNQQDLSHFLTQALDLIGKEAENIPDDAADNNRASVAMKGDAKAAMLPFNQAVKEDVSELFGSEELSEAFQEKAATLFEAAVHARVNQHLVELEEQFELKLEEQYEELTEQLTEQLDDYVSYVAEEWAKENEVAIESSLKNEFSESFIYGLRNLFEQHYVQFPEEQTDVVSALAEKVEELENELNEQVNANIELVEMLQDQTKEDIFDEVSEGLALTQVDKFRTLAESVDSDMDDETYRRKLEIIKENYFGIQAQPSTLYEEVEIEEEAEKPSFSTPHIANYAKAISKTTKR